VQISFQDLCSWCNFYLYHHPLRCYQGTEAPVLLSTEAKNGCTWDHSSILLQLHHVLNPFLKIWSPKYNLHCLRKKAASFHFSWCRGKPCGIRRGFLSKRWLLPLFILPLLLQWHFSFSPPVVSYEMCSLRWNGYRALKKSFATEALLGWCRRFAKRYLWYKGSPNYLLIVVIVSI
jgi:hypothetical protein